MSLALNSGQVATQRSGPTINRFWVAASEVWPWTQYRASLPDRRASHGCGACIEERERAAYLGKCRRDFRDILRRTRADRKARRMERRGEREEARIKAADHARRNARMDAGLPYRTEEEWETL
jgi:hypothetical protein